jgi:hypothetical protein
MKPTLMDPSSEFTLTSPPPLTPSPPEKVPSYFFLRLRLSCTKGTIKKKKPQNGPFSVISSIPVGETGKPIPATRREEDFCIELAENLAGTWQT